MLAFAATVAAAGALLGAVPSWAASATPRARSASAAGSLAMPNDPGFAGCEHQDPITGCTDNEQWDLFGRLTGNTCLAPGGSVPDRPIPTEGCRAGR